MPSTLKPAALSSTLAVKADSINGFATSPSHSTLDAQILQNWLSSDEALRPPAPIVELPSINPDAEDLCDVDLQALMKAFDVDVERGFVPVTDPLVSLPPSGKFGQWEELMVVLSGRLHAHNIRGAIDALPPIEVTETDLTGEGELNRAQLVLSMLAHAYVWGEVPTCDRIPACIAIPWVTVSHRIGRVPVLTHSSIVLTNWRRFDLNLPVTLNNVTTLNLFFGGIDEAVFYLVTLEVEARGAPALAHMLRAQHYARRQAIEPLIKELKAIALVQRDMTHALMRMYENCDPYVFYTRVRSFLRGWRGDAALPDGLLYEGVSENRQLFHGGSAAQSAIIASFDAFLGVSHTGQHSQQYMADMRFYMPGLHREFLKYLETNFSLRSFVISHCCAAGTSTEGQSEISQREIIRDPALVEAYNGCVNELLTFRSKHINMVASYIITPANKIKGVHGAQGHGQTNGHVHKNLGNAPATSTVTPAATNSNTSDDSAQHNERGTGGTSIMPYLKTSRDETRDVLL